MQPKGKKKSQELRTKGKYDLRSKEQNTEKQIESNSHAAAEAPHHRAVGQGAVLPPPPSGPHGCPPGPAATQALIVRLGAGCVPEFRTRCCGLVAPFHGGHPRCRLPGSGRVSLGRGVGGGAGGEATKWLFCESLFLTPSGSTHHARVPASFFWGPGAGVWPLLAAEAAGAVCSATPRSGGRASPSLEQAEARKLSPIWSQAGIPNPQRAAAPDPTRF